MWQQNDIPFERARRVYVSIGRQPSWVVRTALFAGVTVTMLIALLLIVPAILVGLAVFLVLALVHRVRTALGGLGRRESGRRNVTVVRRDDRSSY